MHMNDLINKRVKHKAWGTGIITETAAKTVTVNFNGELKKFVYPDAFKCFLAFEEDNLQEAADSLLEEKQRKEKELREREERERILAEKRREIDRLKQEKRKKSGRKEIRRGNPAFRCERVFTGDGIVRAGADSRGNTRRFKGLEANRLAILTAAGAGLSEADRRIFGVFLIDDVFEGNVYREGFVKSSPKYRINLSSREARALRFWDYYRMTSPGSPAKWGAGLFRDMDDKTAARLLLDIMDLKKGTEEEKTASEMYDYFYRIHKYTIEA